MSVTGFEGLLLHEVIVVPAAVRGGDPQLREGANRDRRRSSRSPPGADGAWKDLVSGGSDRDVFLRATRLLLPKRAKLTGAVLSRRARWRR